VKNENENGLKRNSRIKPEDGTDGANGDCCSMTRNQLETPPDTALALCSFSLLTSPGGVAIYLYILSNKVKNYD
jgi:hypothetical protein